MRLGLFLALALFAIQGFAQEVLTPSETTTTMEMPVTEPEAAELNSTTEFGITVSSINSGSRFANAGLIRHFGENWEIGIRGLMPLEFENEMQIYMGQLFLRYDFVNNENVMFFEGHITQGLFSDISANLLFGGVGGSYGYRRNFTPEFNAGLNLGVDLFTARISRDVIYLSDFAFNNRITVVGGYNF